AARLVRRIRAVTEALLQRAVRRLAGGLEQRAVDVEEPAVVAAPDAALGDEPELERGAALWAVPLEQPHHAAEVAERPQRLAEERPRDRQVAQVVGEADRLPESPEVFTARRARTHARELCVLSGHVAVIVAAEAGRQEGRSRRHGGAPLGAS